MDRCRRAPAPRRHPVGAARPRPTPRREASRLELIVGLAAFVAVAAAFLYLLGRLGG